MPVRISDVLDADGTSAFRTSTPIYVSPERPILNKAFFKNKVSIKKVKVGFSGNKTCRARVVVPKSFYNALETVYMTLKIDNSEVSNDCSLLVRHMFSGYNN